MTKEQIQLMISTFQKMEETLNDLMLQYEGYISEDWMFNDARECIEALEDELEQQTNEDKQ
tara:strand:+ start:662 stop:844 length:183 start_codon:yes stop_codon:yes gene_type:complete